MAEEDKGKGRGKPTLSVKDIVLGEPQPLGDGRYEVGITITVQAGNKPVYGITGQFMVNAAPVGNPQTIIDGKFSETLTVSGEKPVVSLEVKSDFFGDKIFPLRNIELPREKKKGTVELADFIVDPTRVGNKINLLARVIDENGKGAKDAILTLVENSEIVTKKTDNFGNFLHSFELQSNEEREIAIYADGFEEEFRRTFKGRSET